MPLRPNEMSAKALEHFEARKNGVLDCRPRERRMNVRTKVRWPVVFRRRNGESLETTTENLSSRGFYCLSQTPIALDELLVCWLTMPTHDPSGAFGTALLECRVQVVRSEVASTEGLFGVACRIEDFRLTVRR